MKRKEKFAIQWQMDEWQAMASIRPEGDKDTSAKK